MKTFLSSAAVFGVCFVFQCHGGIIGFDSPSDITAGFNTVGPAKFFTAPTGGVSGSASGVIDQNFTNGTIATQAGLTAGASNPVFSVSLFFQFTTPTSTAGGDCLMIGLAGSNTQDPFGTGVTAIELYLVKTAFSSTYSATEASFLGGGGGSNSAGISLQSGSWYRMSIDAAYNTTNSRYDCLFTIYASDAAGSIGQQLFSMTNNGLRLVPSVYGFVASSGPGGAMGIAAIDNFSFPTVSEPSSVLLICMALSPFLAGRFLFRPRRNPMGS